MPTPITTSDIPIPTRIASMLIDHCCMCIIATIFFMPLMLTIFVHDFSSPEVPVQNPFLAGPLFYIAMIGFALYYCKDIVNGRSIAKRILSLQVVNYRTGAVATPLQCLIRDLFLILWPIEFIVALINPKRRIGDRVAGTQLVVFDKTANQPPRSLWKLAIPIAISYAVVFGLFQWMIHTFYMV